MFKDQVFLITGGANGIGLATAQALKARGAQICLWDIDNTALQTAASELDALTAVIDVTQPESIQAALQTLLERFGRLDGVIHCAGIARTGAFETVLSNSIEKLSKLIYSGRLPLLKQFYRRCDKPEDR